MIILGGNSRRILLHKAEIVKLSSNHSCRMLSTANPVVSMPFSYKIERKQYLNLICKKAKSDFIHLSDVQYSSTEFIQFWNSTG